MSRRLTPYAAGIMSADGRGYPDGLKGEQIPIAAQVVSMADVYDALTSERCYKKRSTTTPQ